MYPSAQLNQYNSYQYTPQPPSQQQQQQQQQQQHPAPPIPPRSSPHQPNPHDQTDFVINKSNLQYIGISPAPAHPNQPRIKLYASAGAERVEFERKADLYAILTGLEHLESAFLRSSVTSSDYTTNCNKFLSQYKTWMDVHKALVTSIEAFVLEAGLNVPAAVNRIKAGIPATSVHGGHDSSQQDIVLAAAELVEKFITTFDVTKIALSTDPPHLEVDAIFNYLTDLFDSVVKFPNLPSNHEIKMKLQHWVQFCQGKNCYYEFTDKELRQLSFDIEQTYTNFRKFVADRK